MKNNLNQISVLINTKGERKIKLLQCIKSIQKNTFQAKEIIVGFQTINPFTLNSGIKTLKIESRGTGYAKNQLIKHAAGDILVFTDDDCIVSKKWLETILKVYETNKQISAVFGKVLPYKKRLHRNLYCPSTFLKSKSKIFTKIVTHDQVGSGNNMSIKKSVLNQIGRFKNWLGPGSIGENCDDTEIILHLLTTKHSIYYEPKAIMYHNRWLNKSEKIMQYKQYYIGEIASYTYYLFKNLDIAKVRLKKRFLILLWRFKHLIKLIILRKNINEWLTIIINETFGFIKGFSIGLYYSIIK